MGLSMSMEKEKGVTGTEGKQFGDVTISLTSVSVTTPIKLTSEIL